MRESGGIAYWLQNHGGEINWKLKAWHLKLDAMIIYGDDWTADHDEYVKCGLCNLFIRDFFAL